MKYVLVLLAVLASGPTGNLAHAASEAHGPEGIPTKAIIFAAINLMILLGILTYFLRKPTKEFFASRSALIKKSMDEAKELRDAAQFKYDEYEKRLQGIDAEMKALIEQLKSDGKLERGRIIKAAEEQVGLLQETSGRIMTQELLKAKEELKREAVNLAAELAEELVRKNMTPEDQRRLVEQYLSKMEHLS